MWLSSCDIGMSRAASLPMRQECFTIEAPGVRLQIADVPGDTKGSALRKLEPATNMMNAAT
jgi:hypothetical protein